MGLRTLVLCVLAALLAAGCGARQEGKGDRAGKKHAWPMSAGQLAALKKMSRSERDAWFKDLELPRYEARRRVGEITIDGVLDEPAWKAANVVTLREGSLGGPVKYGTRVRMLWDNEAIYLAYECDDPDVHTTKTKHDDNLWENDLVELFIDPKGDCKFNMELHVAPSGATADVLWADFRPELDWFTQPTWDLFDEKTVTTAWEPKGIAAAVQVDGTLNAPGDTDKGYTVEWRIPYSALVDVVPDEQKGRKLIDLSLFQQAPIEAPRVGTVWRMNFNRCDDSIQATAKDKDGKDVNVGENSAWAPTTGSFHIAFLFGYVTFVE